MTLEIGAGCFLTDESGRAERIYGKIQLAVLLVLLASGAQKHSPGTVEEELTRLGCETTRKSIFRALSGLLEKGLLESEDRTQQIFTLKSSLVVIGEIELLARAIMQLNGNTRTPDLQRVETRAQSAVTPFTNRAEQNQPKVASNFAGHYALIKEVMSLPPYLHEKGRVQDFYVELMAAEVNSGSAITADGYLDYSALLRKALPVHEVLDTFKGQAVIIQGNPGAGKSTIARAHILRAHELGGVGLFVPLIALSQPADLQVRSTSDAFWDYLASQRILIQLDWTPGTTIVLDGLDEVSIRDGEDQRWTLALVDMGMRFSREFGISVIFTGRHEVVHYVCSRTPNLTRFELLPLYVPYSRDLKQADPDALVNANEDLRSAWWRNFCSVYGVDSPFPEVFKRGALEHLSCEPLMLTMLAAMWLATPDLDKFQSKLQIFDAATQLVLSRDYDRMQNLAPLVATGLIGDYDSKSFRDLLSISAYTAWPNGGRVAVLRQVERISNARSLGKQYKLLLKAAEVGKPSALLLFYFRTTDLTRRDEGKVEFTHKSFSDYFAVQYMIETLSEMGVKSMTFTEWVEAFGAADLTSAHCEFLEDALKSMDTRKSELIREKLEEIWATWDRVELSGLVVDLSSEDPQVLINRARRAVRNLAVLIILSIQGLPHQRHWPNSAPTLVGLLRTPSTSDQLRRILKRTWFSQTSFEGANLSYTTLDSCHIHGSNLTDSWLMFTSFADGKIDHSDFSRASGRSSTWSRARVSNCQFADAQLARADFHKSDVANSTFLGADLRDVGLTHSILANVSFFGADLRGATFEGAEVSAVDLDQAKADERMLDEEVLDSGTITSFRQLGWSLVDGVLCRSH